MLRLGRTLWARVSQEGLLQEMELLLAGLDGLGMMGEDGKREHEAGS